MIAAAFLTLILLACDSDEPTAPSGPRTGSSTGTVTSDWWGAAEPVVGATVRWSGVGSGSGTADAAGNYRFDAVPSGTDQVSVVAPLHESATEPEVVVAVDSTHTADVTLVRSTAVVRGSALSRFDASPVTDGFVQFVPERRETRTLAEPDETADEEEHATRQDDRPREGEEPTTGRGG